MHPHYQNIPNGKLENIEFVTSSDEMKMRKHSSQLTNFKKNILIYFIMFSSSVKLNLLITRPTGLMMQNWNPQYWIFHQFLEINYDAISITDSWIVSSNNNLLTKIFQFES